MIIKETRVPLCKRVLFSRTLPKGHHFSTVFFWVTVSKRNYCTQKFCTARCLQHANFEIYSNTNVVIKLLDISPAKYSSWQEMRAVLFRKACSNSVYWADYGVCVYYMIIAHPIAQTHWTIFISIVGTVCYTIVTSGTLPTKQWWNNPNVDSGVLVAVHKQFAFSIHE